ncbi:hypothetical protein FDP41_001300 [Naegleria fowleri]|uniref:PIPK domain-containing protein n=1 Tax=Naegleria fowleri TaxID=5763 RepID=A0A6A5BYE3_NAEFO|nr:uncharacterized protein FDP41_001300 [Naegleria fowleri]KAF0979632.1 hypothetical protein FDP41_001300 [Naegleria fowleri]
MPNQTILENGITTAVSSPSISSSSAGGTANNHQNNSTSTTTSVSTINKGTQQVNNNISINGTSAHGTEVNGPNMSREGSISISITPTGNTGAVTNGTPNNLSSPNVHHGGSLSPRASESSLNKRANSFSSNNVGNTPATPVHTQFALKPEDNSDEPKKIIKNAKKKKWHVNAMGEIIYKEHNSYNLMRQIQMGIRSAISEITPKKQKDVLTYKDFTNTNKMPFPEKGTTRTPPHEFPYFDFYDYAPFPFRHLRERFGIDASDFLVCLCHEQSLSILGTPGKSGALFFFSADMQYMLKTVTKKESKFLRKILPDYYNHVMANPNTLITRFYGMYSIKPKGGKNVRFVIMNNVFDTTMYVAERYDLKGSTIGREASEKERKRETPVLKDLDFLKREKKLAIGPQMKSVFLHQLNLDAEWLEKMKIMDYSLLVGVHKIDPETEADILKEAQNCTIKLSDSDIPSDMNGFTAIHGQSSIGSSSAISSSSYLGGDAGTASSSLNISHPIADIAHQHETSVNSSEITIEITPGEENQTTHPQPVSQTVQHTTPNSQKKLPFDNTSSQGRKSGDSTASFFGRFMPNTNRASVSLKKLYRGPRASLFQQFHGGTLSLPLEDGTREIYYFGIIDLLQKWNNKKQIENIFKGFVSDRSQISAVSPKHYAARFVKFLDEGLI